MHGLWTGEPAGKRGIARVPRHFETVVEERRDVRGIHLRYQIRMEKGWVGPNIPDELVRHSRRS